jgi:hypothetical protein
VVGKLVNVDAAIGQNALIAIDIADAGIGGSNALQAFRALHRRRHEYLART